MGVGLLAMPTSAEAGEEEPISAEQSELRREIALSVAAGHADLTGRDFRGFDFTGLSLAGANLSDADLSDAKLQEVDLSNARLVGTVLRGADLSSADLTEADLTRADFGNAKLTGAKLYKAILDEVKFKPGDRFDPKEWSSASFKNAVMDDVTIIARYSTKRVTFDGANLRGAQFHILGGAIERWSFEGAVLDGAIFVPGQHGARLTNITWSKASLRSVDFSKVRMQGTLTFDEADLTGANLRFLNRSDWNDPDSREIDSSAGLLSFKGAVLLNADLSAACLGRADFSAANLTDAKLRQAEIKKTKFDHATNVEGTDFEAAQGLQDNQSLGIALNFTAAKLDSDPIRSAVMLARLGAVAVGERPDVKDADWHGANLAGINFDGFRLEGVDLRGAELYWATFKGAELVNVDLANAIVAPPPGSRNSGAIVADFSDARMTGVNLAGVEFWTVRGQSRGRAEAKGATIEAVFDGAESVDPSAFSGADFSGSSFRGATLKSAPRKCRRCDFTEARFQDSVQLDAEFSGATFDGATFGGGLQLLCNDSPSEPLELTNVTVKARDKYSGFRVENSGSCNVLIVDSTVENLMLNGASSALGIVRSRVIGGATQKAKAVSRAASCRKCDFSGTTFTGVDFAEFGFSGGDLSGAAFVDCSGFPGEVSGLGTVTGLDTVSGF